MTEQSPQGSHIDHSILDRMTPEGRDLVQRVLKSTDHIITLTDEHKHPDFMPSETDSSTVHSLVDIDAIKELPLSEQIDWLVRNFGRRALREAGARASRGLTAREILGDEATQKLKQSLVKRSKQRPRQSFRDAIKPR